MNPEYYKCITSSTIDSFTVGKIYKIRNPNNLEDEYNFINDNGKRDGYSGTNFRHFKPSTKEAFDLQESKIITPKKKRSRESMKYLIPILNNLDNE